MKIINALIIFSAMTLLISCGGSGGGGSSSNNASSSVKSAPSSQSSSSSVAASSLSSSSSSSVAASSLSSSSSSLVAVSSSVASSSASSESLATACDLPTKFSWESTQPLITAKAANHISIKDPTIVYYNNLYHVFATVSDTTRNAWSAVYLNFSDFSQADAAPQISLANKPAGDAVAPQVFYFRPHNKWYLISQWGAKYSTNTDISNPDTWTAPKPLLANGPNVGLDYWVICDDAYCHLFFAGDDGNLYRSKTTIASFPNFSGYDIVMSDEVAKVFEAPNVYKVEGKNQYLLLVEAMDPRYFRSWTATSLDGPWVPLADQQSAPFAGPANVSNAWSNGISHGEMIRSGYDQKLEINPCNMQFLYQGFDPAAVVPGSDYPHLPYRLGLLKPTW